MPIRTATLLVLGSLATVLSAQTVKIQGLIKARSGATMILETSDAPKVVVVLTDNTKVGQIQGVLKARRKDMSMAALIPGLEVQVEGANDAQGQVIASLVKFKGNDLQRAQSIQAGLHETKAQVQQSKEELEKQQAALEVQKQSLHQQQEQLTAQQQKIAANKAAIDAAIARFGQLDDYYILDEITILFANGKTVVTPDYKQQLIAFAKKAKTVDSYIIQVIGYASSTGSASLNQKLSEDRAHNVTIILSQDGNIPLMNMLAPGAMGESRQISNEKSGDGEAENRRVVVRVLQNKGVAGVSGTQ